MPRRRSHRFRHLPPRSPHLDATTTLKPRHLGKGHLSRRCVSAVIRPSRNARPLQIVGEEHYRVARDVQQDAAALQESLQDIIAILGMDELLRKRTS